MSVVVGGSWSPSPEALTLSRAKAEVARYVKMPDAPEGLEIAAEKLRSALRELNQRTWNWQWKSHDITLVADDATYLVAADYKRSRHMHVIDSNSKEIRPIEFLPPKEFALAFPYRVPSGSPCHYTVKNAHADGLITTDVPVSASYITIYPKWRHYYFARVIYPASPSAIFDVPNEVESFLLWRAKEEMAADFKPDKVTYAKSKANKHWRELVADDEEHDDGYQ